MAKKKVPETRSEARDQRFAQMQDYKRTFGSEQGKRVLHDLLAHHYMMRSTVTTFPIDSLTLAYREGERNVVLRILNELNLDPKAFEQLLEEANTHVR